MKWAGIALLLTAAIWAGVIAWWQATHRLISPIDVLVYLVALPIIVLLCIGTFRLLLAVARKKTAAPGNDQQEKNDQDEIRQADPHTLERQWKLPIVGAWAVTSLGNTAEEFVEALLEKRSRPRPDPLLVDEEGFPLLAGRVPDIDTQTTQDNLEDIVSRNGFNNVPASDEWRDAFLRTASLLDQIIEQVHGAWPIEFESDRDALDNRSIATLRGAASERPATNQGPEIHVKLLVPADFKPYEKQLMLAFVFEKISALGVPAKQLHIEAVPSSDDAAALSLLDQFNLQTHRNDASEALLLLASDSTLCTTIVDDWHSAGRLFSPRNPAGLMMGEAAFGILCLSDKALEAAKLDAQCQITRAVFSKRDLPADQPGKPSYTCLTAAASDALRATGIAGETIGAVACDADHRSSRTLECIGAMLNLTPHLDAVENRLATNEACGHIGIASVLGALVAGAMQAKSAKQPVLLCNVGHIVDRAAALLLPAEDMSQPA